MIMKPLPMAITITPPPLSLPAHTADLEHLIPLVPYDPQLKLTTNVHDAHKLPIYHDSQLVIMKPLPPALSILHIKTPFRFDHNIQPKRKTAPFNLKFPSP